MLKKLALASVAAVAFAAPSQAITIQFQANVTTLPAWTTATYVQDFDDPQLIAGQPFKTGEADLGTAIETIAGPANSSALITAPSGFLTTNYLTLSNSSYSINFGGAQQFVSFLIKDFQAGSNTFTINGGATNLFAGLAGLANGSSGLIYIDMGGAAGITSLTLASTRPGVGNVMKIDQIASAAPEAATWGMMILGFGVVGMQMRRRRKEDGAEAAFA